MNEPHPGVDGAPTLFGVRLTTPVLAIGIAVLLVIVHVVLLPVFHESLYGPLSFAIEGGDSPRYTGAADAILDGEWPSSYQLLSSGYVLLLVLSDLVGAGIAGVVVLQLLVTVPAALALHDLGRRAGSHTAGLVAAVLYVANPFAARWRHYVLTDALFDSFVVLTVWAAVRARRDEPHGVPVLVACAVVTSLLRPNGVIVAAVVASWVVLGRVDGRRVVLGVVAAWLAVGGVALFSSRAATVEDYYNVPTEIRRGQVVSDFGGHPDGLRLDMPRTDHRGRLNVDAAVFAVQHPIDTGRLVGARLFYELSQIRPGSSTAYNLLLPAGLAVAYAFAVLGAVRSGDRSLVVLILLVAGSQLAVVAAVLADGDGRYLLWSLPIIGVLSSTGFVSTIEAVRGRRRAS